MLKKTITFTDFNDEEVTEEHYFHLSKAELMEMEVGHGKDGMAKALERIVASEDGKAIIAEIKNFILKSYGKKSDDGKRFIKTDALREEFESSEAYSTLFMEVATNAEAAAEFINGIIPKGLHEEMARLSVVEEPEVLGVAQARNPGTTPGPAEPRVLTRAEITEMSQAELSHLLATGQAVLASEE